MRFHVLFSWLLSSACSYDFGGADGVPDGTGGAIGAGSVTTSASTSTPASGSVASTVSADAVSVASVTTGATLPDPLPPCGGVADNFDNEVIDPVRWTIIGDVKPHDGHVDMNVEYEIAELVLTTIPEPPCVFSFRRDSDDDLSLTVHADDASASLGMTYRDSGEETWIRRNFADEAMVLDGSSNADAFAIVILEAKIVLLARIRDTATWRRILLEDKPPWVAASHASIFRTTEWSDARVDDYGVIPVHVADLGL